MINQLITQWLPVDYALITLMSSGIEVPLRTLFCSVQHPRSIPEECYTQRLKFLTDLDAVGAEKSEDYNLLRHRLIQNQRARLVVSQAVVCPTTAYIYGLSGSWAKQAYGKTGIRKPESRLARKLVFGKPECRKCENQKKELRKRYILSAKL